MSDSTHDGGNEFIDTYSDDILCLQLAREALLTHPKIAIDRRVTESSLCRLLITVMVGSVEAMLLHWKERDSLEIIESYWKKGVKNGERVKVLCDSFRSKNLPVDTEVFDDYLAIKYLRNAVIHASWSNEAGRVKQDQIDWIRDRGFPADARELDSSHCARVDWVHRNMLFYLAMVLAGKSPVELPEGSLSVPLSVEPDLSGIIFADEWPRFHWQNLERFSSHVTTRILEDALKPSHELYVGCSADEFRSQGPDQHTLFWLKCQRGALSSCETFLSLRQHALGAEFSWNEYVRLIPTFEDLGAEHLPKALSVFRTLHGDGCYPAECGLPPRMEEMPDDKAEHLLGSVCELPGTLGARSVLSALRIGKAACSAVPNATPVGLFSKLMPVLCPERTGDWSTIAKYVTDVFELGLAWTCFRKGSPYPKDSIENNRAISAMLSSSDH